MAELMHSLKSFTAHKINQVEESHGPVWEEEVFDRYIRSESDLPEKFRYICRNPWDAGIAGACEDYPWVWTQEDAFGNSGSTPVSGVGESVSPSLTLAEKSSFRRDAETHARDGSAPQNATRPTP